MPRAVESFVMRAVSLFILAAGFAAGRPAQAANVMHCFVFTQVESASDADWAAWKAATGKLPRQIPGLKQVWYGKLAKTFSQIGPDQRFDAESTRKFAAGESFPLTIKRVDRQYGACFQFKDRAAFDAYGKHPAHEAWLKLYEKVRVDGSATFQILDQ